MKTDPTKLYMIVGDKVLDDGTIAYYGQAEGSSINNLLQDALKALPSGTVLRVVEAKARYQVQTNFKELPL